MDVRTHEIPGENIARDLKARNVLAMNIDETFGGGGASLQDTLSELARTAQSDGSAGLMFAMHLSQLTSMARHLGDNDTLRAELGQICEGRQLLASVTSERAVGGDIFGTTCAFERTGDQITFTKASPNISYADLADAYLITVMDDRQPRPRQRLVLARRDQITLTSDWTNSLMGMTGFSNAAYTLTVTVPETQVFKDPYPIIARNSMTPSTHLFWAAAWCGMAAGFLTKTRAFVKDELAKDSPEQQEMQALNARLHDRLGLMQALVRDTGRTWDAATPGALDFALAAQLNRLKTETSEMLVSIATEALKILGLRGYATGGKYSIAAEIANALSAPILVSNHRLRRNSSEIEPFVPLDL